MSGIIAAMSTTDDIAVDLGERIRKLRKARGWSQTELGEKLGGLSQRAISGYENGSTSPSIITVIEMADLFEVTLDHLLVGKVAVGDGTSVVSQAVLDRLDRIEDLPEEEKELVDKLLDTFIERDRLRRLASGNGGGPSRSG